MTDVTRETSRLMSHGAMDAKQWNWGPFYLATSNIHVGRTWALGIKLGPFGLHFILSLDH